MNATMLLEHFDRLAEAPDAVPRLRRFILDLAVRGKLVEQHPSDEPASSLLAHVSSEWARLQGEGTGKKGKDVTDLSEKDGPFALPPLWQFVCLGEVLQMINGRAFKPTEWRDKGLPIVRIQNLNNPAAPFNHCDPSTVDDRHLLQNGDFLISWSGTPGTSFGAFIWQRGEGALNQHIFRCVQVGEAFEARFLRLAINTQLNVLISQAQGGVGLQHVTKGTLEKLPLALPPLAEQHRIVAKVDELMALCDQLEAAQQERERRRGRLALASVQRLNQPAYTDSPKARREHTRFHLQHLSRLTTRSDQIKALRHAILNQAVKGHLAAQHATDEPAAELLKRLRSDIQLYGTENRVQPASVDLVTNENVPFALPSSWLWTRFASVCRVITDGDHLPPPKSDSGVAFLTIGNISSGELDFTNCRYVPYDYFEKIMAYRRPATGDLLYTVVGATYGRPAMVGTRREFCVQRHIAIVKPAAEVLPSYLYLLLTSPFFYDQAARSLTGTAQPTIPLRALRNFLVPLPPLAEQHRIVARTDDLMGLCDQLEVQLITLHTVSRRLLENLLDRALGVARVPASLKSGTPPSATANTDHKTEKASRFMSTNPTLTVDQLIECIDDLGGATTPERLLKHAGLSEDVAAFYDLLRAARDSGKVSTPLGAGAKIRRQVDAD